MAKISCDVGRPASYAQLCREAEALLPPSAAAELRNSRASKAQQARRRRERSGSKRHGKAFAMIRFFQKNIVKQTVVTLSSQGAPQWVLPENPYRTCLHFYTPVSGDAVHLFLHSSNQLFLGGGIIYYVFPSNNPDSVDLSCL